jgi:hypothetical protein
MFIRVGSDVDPERAKADERVETMKRFKPLDRTKRSGAKPASGMNAGISSQLSLLYLLGDLEQLSALNDLSRSAQLWLLRMKRLHRTV